MKAIGFNQGQFGDLCMNLVACRAFKEQYEGELTFGINKKYAELAPIFLENNLIDDIHIWDAYNNWPAEKDKQYLEQEKFQLVFNPMPSHTSDSWYLNRHQTEETCLMHQLIPPKNLQIELTKYFQIDSYPKIIAVNFNAETRKEDKTFPTYRAKEICSLIKKLGYEPVQIGLPSHVKICENQYFEDFFQVIKFVLGCKCLLTVDSAMAWIMSGYKKETIGFYSFNYYNGAKTAKNWQPINPNAIYLEEKSMMDIKDEAIIEKIKQL